MSYQHKEVNKMKIYKLLIFVMASLIIMVNSPCSAQISGAADTSKAGSLLVWPTVQTNSGNETYIIINNSSSKDVFVKCFWEVKDIATNPTSQCLFSDFAFQLSGSSPVIFRASDGSRLDGQAVAAGMGVSEKGALKCWAVDETLRKQISWNHLSGFAIIVQGDNTLPTGAKPTTSALQYSAWRFAANVIKSSGEFADGFWVGPVGDTNIINLKASPTTVVDPANCPEPYNALGCSLPNAAYDACPKYITFDFLAEPSGKSYTDGYALNTLALVPCKTDLTGLTLNTKTQLDYTIWNENDVMYSGLSQCANCAYTVDLGSLYVLRNQRLFQKKYLGSPCGHFRVVGEADSFCATDAVSTPLLGVMLAQMVGSKDIVAIAGSTGGKETADYGYILWDPIGPYYQSLKKRIKTKTFR
jgi:hypothetical protein